MSDNKYSLYASVIQPVPKGIKYSFIAPYSKHLLVYSESEPKGQMPFVKLSEKVNLSPDEKIWLKNCKDEISDIEEKEQAKKQFDLMNKFLDRCIIELQKEQAELSKKA